MRNGQYYRHMTHNYNYIRMPRQSADFPELGATLGRNVHSLRIEQHISASALSYVAKISRPLLARIERGEADVRLSYIERLADALCVDPLQLLEP